MKTPVLDEGSHTPCTTQQEEADNYHSVIVRAEQFRVILCRDGIQWILQRRAGLRHGQARWEGKVYCTTEKALMRVWASKTGTPCAALGLLPETIEGR